MFTVNVNDLVYKVKFVHIVRRKPNLYETVEEILALRTDGDITNLTAHDYSLLKRFFKCNKKKERYVTIASIRVENKDGEIINTFTGKSILNPSDKLSKTHGKLFALNNVLSDNMENPLFTVEVYLRLFSNLFDRVFFPKQ